MKTPTQSGGRHGSPSPPIDASGVLPDGAEIRDVLHLKRYLVANIDVFTRCLAGKLLVYATGRPMTYGDRRVIHQMVGEIRKRGNGFLGLLIAAVQSDVFRTR